METQTYTTKTGKKIEMKIWDTGFKWYATLTTEEESVCEGEDRRELGLNIINWLENN